jgi:hypothetical protein
MASPILRFLLIDHTQRRTTVVETPLDEWSDRRRGFSYTTENTTDRHPSIPSVWFEPTVSAGERPQTYGLDRAATATERPPTYGLDQAATATERPQTYGLDRAATATERRPTYGLDQAATGTERPQTYGLDRAATATERPPTYGAATGTCNVLLTRIK